LKPNRQTISIVILTKNEANDLPGCLDSLAWCEDVHVVDSESSDSTCEVASSRGAKVATHAFQSFGDQRNWSLDNLSFTSEWVLFLDADERSTDGFRKEILAKVDKASKETAGFFCCWKLMLDEVWLRRSDAFPRWQMRIVRLGRARFRSVGHGQMESEVDGRLGYVREPYLHYPFSKGMDHWFEKHRRYAKQEAQERLREDFVARDLFSSHTSRRNIALKKLVVRMPCWPGLRFFHAYLWRMGFLEGKAGYRYCRDIARYEAMIVRNFRELRRNGKFNHG